MINELVLILALFVTFSMVILSYFLFGKYGLICWTVIATIVANIEVLVLIKAFGLQQTLGNIMFASTFLVTDILSEIYSKEDAKKAVNIGIFSSICFIILSQLWFLYTPAEGDWAMPHMKAIFTNTPRIMFVGVIVYAIVQRFDVWFYHVIWKFTEKRTGTKTSFLWLRNNLATLTSQLLNTLLFTFGVFWGVFDMPTLIDIILSSYILFVFTSIFDTPFLYIVRKYSQKHKPKL